MNYYLLFDKFIDGEGSFSKQEPWNKVLKYNHPQHKFLIKKAIVTVDSCYSENGMSDYLKIGRGKLASKKIQQVFFDNGFTGAQFVPVEVHNGKVYQDYAFINPLAHYDLMDPEASKAKKFDDRIFGGYMRASSEKIDRKKFDACNIQHDFFTLSTYKSPYFASERVKDALEAAGVTGIKYIPMEFSS